MELEGEMKSLREGDVGALWFGKNKIYGLESIL
jgi:hypothetical protein